MKLNPLKFLLLIIFFLTIGQSKAQQLAFPGAEGYGKYAKGGRGGVVYEVTNLNDSGPGSFRTGVTQGGVFNPVTGSFGPVTVVFRVSGTIELLSDIKISRSFLTIAGQTAPGDGICLKGRSLILNGAKIGGNHGNIIIRNLRSRPGGNVSTGLYGFDMENCQNVIVDHCSFGWANEECAAMYDTKNITVQYSIVSEGLYSAGHAKGVRSYGGVWGGQYVSYHHNLIAHNVSRTVRFNGSRAHDTTAVIDYRNNVIYNWGSSGACYGGEVIIPGGVSQVNIVNNYYKPGPATSTTLKFLAASYATPAYGTGQWYVAGNVMHGNSSLSADNWLAVDVSANPTATERALAKSTVPFSIAHQLPDESANDAYVKVLANAGAILPKRDAIDERVVNETSNGTATSLGTYGKLGIMDGPVAASNYVTYNSTTPPDDNDHDGMADAWELNNGLDPSNANDRNNVNTDGYTMLEVYLNSLGSTQNLPLTFLSFDAKLDLQTNHKIQINWSTTNEINTNKFIVESSKDGVNFSAIAEILAHNTNGVHHYHSTAQKTSNGVSYYRLKQVDNDGKYTFSKIVAVDLKIDKGVNLYPNPVNNYLTFIHPLTLTNTTININSTDGKIKISAIAQANTNQSEIDVSSLKPGVYLLNFFGKEETLVLKFIKK
jgi:hypothetical protein